MAALTDATITTHGSENLEPISPEDDILVEIHKAIQPDHEEFVAAGCEKLNEILTNNQSVSILFAGKTGVGKSSLINGLVGSEVAKEGGGAKPTTGIEALSEPHEVKKPAAEGSEVTIQVWDSPGLQDGLGKDRAYLKRLSGVSKIADLVVYCINASERFDQSAKDALRDFAKACPKDIWCRAVIALTRANLITYPVECTSTEEKVAHFQKIVHEYVSVITSILKRSGVKQEMYAHLPMVPTGYHREVPYNPNPWELHPQCTHWLQPFWFTCLSQCKSVAVQTAIVVHNAHRISNARAVGDDNPIHEQPLVVHDAYREFIANIVSGIYRLRSSPQQDQMPSEESSWWQKLWSCIKQVCNAIINGNRIAS